MMPRTWRRVLPTLSIVLGVGASGCGDDPLSANESLANHFQRLADDLDPDQHSRQRSLLFASRALRLGSPVDQIEVSANGSTAVFDVVAIQWGFLRNGSVDLMGAEVIAWRGRDAQQILHLYTRDSILAFPEPPPPPGGDSAVYIDNRPPAVVFLKGMSERWYGIDGSGKVVLQAQQFACAQQTSGNVCQEAQGYVDFAATISLVAETDLSVEGSLSAGRTPIRGIRYLSICDSATSCMMSWPGRSR